jgi:hypothetical protein
MSALATTEIQHLSIFGESQNMVQIGKRLDSFCFVAVSI